MQNTRKANPTDYKGIRYKSKCEAMFARYLELRIEEFENLYSSDEPFFSSNTFGNGRGGFVYEPLSLQPLRSNSNWNPDFLLWQMYCEPLPDCHWEFIEYKPSKPTSAYCELMLRNASEAMQDYIGNELYIEEWINADIYIYYGSVWTDRIGRIRICPTCRQSNMQGKIIQEYHYDWLDGFRNSILETRFDLDNHA